jgi:hypothetical protein
MNIEIGESGPVSNGMLLGFHYRPMPVTHHAAYCMRAQQTNSRTLGK